MDNGPDFITDAEELAKDIIYEHDMIERMRKRDRHFFAQPRFPQPFVCMAQEFLRLRAKLGKEEDEQ